MGAGAPQQRAARRAELAGLRSRGGALVQGHWRDFGDWESPEGEVLKSRGAGRAVLARVDQTGRR